MRIILQSQRGTRAFVPLFCALLLLLSGGAAGAADTPISEGVHVTHADQWQQHGLTGKGVKIGMIDTAFTRYATFLGDARVVTQSFRDDGAIEGSAGNGDPNDDADTLHGTACAEIVHAMAPDAELDLATIDSAETFVTAVDWLTTTAHVAVITISGGWTVGFPKDGTNALDTAIDRAKAAGVFFVKSAGNDGSGKIGSVAARGHYTATFSDTDGDGYHDFIPAVGSLGENRVSMKIGKGPVAVALDWDDWKQNATRYALELYDATGAQVAHADIARAVPVQVIGGTFPAGTYTLRVRKVRPTDANLRFEIEFSGAQLAQTNAEGSITVPGDARGAVTVGGATWQEDRVFASSSHGPTLDGRPKPDLVAPSCVSSRVYATIDESPFCGTSAAAPHVAGAAALYKQAFPNASPDDILTYLRQHAKKLTGADGELNTSGAGRLDLGAPPK